MDNGPKADQRTQNDKSWPSSPSAPASGHSSRPDDHSGTNRSSQADNQRSSQDGSRPNDGADRSGRQGTGRDSAEIDPNQGALKNGALGAQARDGDDSGEADDSNDSGMRKMSEGGVKGASNPGMNTQSSDKTNSSERSSGSQQGKPAVSNRPGSRQ